LQIFDARGYGSPPSRGRLADASLPLSIGAGRFGAEEIEQAHCEIS
jgi:hypothetical protein